MSDIDKIHIRATHVSNGNRHFATIVFDCKKIGAPGGTWARVVVERLARLAFVEPFSSQEVRMLYAVFELIANDVLCRSIYARPMKEIWRTEMRQLFAQVEELIGRSEKWGDAVKAKASMGFRRRMTEMIKEGEFAESLRRHSTYYRTKLTGKHLPRPILSPELGDLKMPEDAPIDAFPHTNAIDLKNKIKKRLDEDVRTILDACVSDLRSWQKIRQQLLELARIERSDIEMDNAINFLNGGQYERERSLQNFYEKGIFRPERFLSAASKICTESLHWARIKEIKVIGKSVHSLAMVRALDPNEFVVRNVHFGHVILMALRAHFLELANAFIILLIHTGWNAASLRSLTRPRVREAASGYLIQGFKGKTGKDTPEVFLDKSHRGAIEAIELMLWNHQNLKQRGLISPDDMQLWHMWPKAGVIHQMGSLDEPIRLLGEKYGVKRFTLDQIRSHMLVRLAVRHGTAEAARVAAGHASLHTTGTYLDQFLVRLISKSINLEFQRRFESVIVAIHEDLNGSSASLLKAVGDGTSCVNPSAPPEHDWLLNGQCSARNCHSDGGCSNNKIVVTRARLEEIVRFNQYHRQRWRKLYARNPENFEKVLGPAILLNSALLLFLREGLLKDTIAPLIEEITKKIGGARHEK